MSTAQTENSRPGNRRLRSWLRSSLLLVCTIVVCLGILVSASNPASAELMSLSPFLVLAWAFMVVAVFFLVITYPIQAARSRRLRAPALDPLVAPALIIALTAICGARTCQWLCAGTSRRTYSTMRHGRWAPVSIHGRSKATASALIAFAVWNQTAIAVWKASATASTSGLALRWAIARWEVALPAFLATDPRLAHPITSAATGIGSVSTAEEMGV
ncbi:hypothetical protein [Nocardia sp. NPDC050710]|uniref:hypothetical protein n=1 Tax=Nocardia sp. NPDC050710 TaxID=3157220 RepID=UPI0033FB4B46